jgi:photosystem II stability/assembly factor-like uncharacterized protein
MTTTESRRGINALLMGVRSVYTGDPYGKVPRELHARKSSFTNISICSVLLVSLFAITSPASATQHSGSLQTMKLLTSQVGWTATEDRLFWTTDGGENWKDITPHFVASTEIASVFFLDISNGWVLFANTDDPNVDEPVFEVASTSDAGVNWSPMVKVIIPNLNPRSTTLSGDGQIDFLDTLHGWMNLDVASSANFRLGILLSTSDGGSTWNRTPDSPHIAGSVHFSSPVVGWLAGGPGDENLYVTRDGSKSWHELSLKAPQEAYPAIYPTYELPVFQDSSHGFLPVTYSAVEGSQSALVLFTTDDGGQTWKADRTLPNLGGASTGVNVPSTIIGSDLIAATVPSHSRLTLTTLRHRGYTTRSAASVVLPDSGPLKLNFANSRQGWVLAGGELISTADGGFTWTDITPATVPHPAGSRGEAQISGSPLRKIRSLNPEALQSSTDLGFHICDASTITNMQVWWDYSPFYDSGIYIGGISRTCRNIQITSNWVATVEGQGWGLLPTWVGPQAPCTSFPHKFTDKNALAQGKAEADSAVAAASKLGLAGTIIYYDMEAYDPKGQNGTCGNAVTEFLSSWAFELQKNGFAAGVYGSAIDANANFVNMSPLPDDIWIAKTPLKGGTPSITIWGLKPLCDSFSLNSCNYWSNSQRIHQYLSNQKGVKWGGVPFPLVDLDIVDAQVASSGESISAGAKIDRVTPRERRDAAE